ncbi:ATP-binding cassette domain-containing protein [Streptomyces sp. NPDC046931]|uniref:ATP-binding cassette domain-containing protein n=1 Tax=Streptomyces sp. NPDC046931 TaxID=3154806 RepID=UPI0034089A23
MTTDANGLAVDVRGLRKQYGDVTAVDGIDLEIRRGEVLGLLGPNGAGKTTTVEILQGNRDRDGGEVSVVGADPARATRAWRSKIGIVRQDESAPAELTVRETVRHFARYHPRPRDPEEVIGLVGLEAEADSRIKGLSGGQRRRLDEALGAIGDPEPLLLDEPTTGFGPADHPVVREGLRAMLNAEPDPEVVAAAAGPQAEALAAELRPDIVLMDLRMPGGAGGDSIARMTESGLPCPVIVLTTCETDRDILRAVEAGAAGYLLKDLPRAEPADAVRAAARARRCRPARWRPALSTSSAPGRSARACRAGRRRFCAWWPRAAPTPRSGDGCSSGSRR